MQPWEVELRNRPKRRSIARKRPAPLPPREAMALAVAVAAAYLARAMEEQYGAAPEPGQRGDMVGADKFAERFKALRLKTKTTQAVFADFMGVSLNAIATWESGRCAPGFWSIIRICEYFKVSPNWLLTGRD